MASKMCSGLLLIACASLLAGPAVGAPSYKTWDAVTLSFAQPLASDARIQVFDVAGKLVRTLSEEWVPAGTRQLRWDGRSDTGRIAPAGVYVVSIESERGRLTKRLVRLR